MRVLSGPAEGHRHPNPYIKILLGGLDRVLDLRTFRWRSALFTRYDVLHLHWPEHLVAGPSARRRWLKTALLGIVILRAKALRTKLVWTVHNETPHEAPGFSTQVASWMWQRSADAAIFLTEAGLDAYPFAGRAPVEAVIRHGDLTDSLPDEVDIDPHPRAAAEPYLMTFGLLRPYKGIEQLIRATIAGNGDFDLIIAGPPRDRDHLASLERLAAASSRVSLEARYLPQVELASIIRASSGVVLPYLRMNNSSALMLALALRRPVLVPDNLPNREIAELVGPGWIHTYRGQLRSTDLDEFFERAIETPPRPPALDAFAWDDVIAAHDMLYRKLVSSS